MAPIPRALVWATDLDVLPADHVVIRRDGYLAVHSPSNPVHWWGNLLLFDGPPEPGDGPRWERLFAAEFADEPRVRHRTFGWDRVDGAEGEAEPELARRGYELERSVGLVATPDQLSPHPRANREVEIRALDPSADERLWGAVTELQVANRDPIHEAGEHRAFSRARQHDLRALFRAGRGAWYVALAPDGDVVASCGVVATGDRGRFQAVDTAQAHRSRGICSRLVVDAAHDAASRHGLAHLVIAADAGYHALGIYESLGFRRQERLCGACRQPPAA
jgi:ribosomal protein S18 acetylase RimI-like enzyme